MVKVKDRLKNVANVYSTIFTGKTAVTSTAIGGQNKGIVIPKGSTAAGLVTQSGKKNIVTTAAEHPFLTAAVGAVGYTAISGAVGSSSAVIGTTGRVATGAASKSVLSTSGKYLLAGSAGLIAGTALAGTKGGNAQSNIDQNPEQNTTPIQDTKPQQTTPVSLSDNPTLEAGRDIFYSTAKYSYNYPTQQVSPYQNTSPLLSASAVPTVEGGSSSSGINPLWLVVGVGAYLLLSEGKA